MSQPTKEVELSAQLQRLHRVYGQRLVVFSRVLRDIDDPGAQRLAECIRAAACHNERWERFFTNDANCTKLTDEKWDLKQAQQVYQPLIRLMLSEPALHCVLQDGLEIHHIIDKHNAAVYGKDYRSYLHIGMFPAFIIDHFFYVRKLLKSYGHMEHSVMLQDIWEFILWLDEQLKTPS